MEHFAVALTFGPDHTRLHLTGELDAAAVPVLREYFEKACTADHTLTVFDLNDLTYCVSSGIRALLQAAAHCARSGTDTRVVDPQAAVRRIIELTHTADALNLHDHDHDTREPW